MCTVGKYVHTTAYKRYHTLVLIDGDQLGYNKCLEKLSHLVCQFPVLHFQSVKFQSN